MIAQVSIVVVTYNRPKDVNETIASLLNQSVMPYEIIVIDNGSSPPVKIEFENEHLKKIRFNEERGLSNARNYGIAISQGEYVAFFDDDAVADKHWLEEIHKHLGSADIIGGPIEPIFQATPPKWWTEKDFGGYVGVGNVFRNGAIWGSNMVFRKEVFKTIGLFNPDIGRRKGKLLSNEDKEIIGRAKRSGFKTNFVPTAIVYHKVPRQRMEINYIIKWRYNEGNSEKTCIGFHPLRTCFDILLCLTLMATPKVIFSSRATKIKRMARMASLIGRLF